jgi:hypothetical protein
MAFLKPEMYCADWCLAAGQKRDIIENFSELGPKDVLKFCEECVLNFDAVAENSGCQVPGTFYEKEPPQRLLI